MYIGKNDSMGTTDGGTSYGNLLYYPGVLARSVLEKEGFQFYSEAELPPEKADIVFCSDLSPELWQRVKNLPKHVYKVLQACESPIYARYSHFASEVLMNPVWDAIMTWNRSYEADYVIHYDIPVAGKKVSPIPPVAEPIPDSLLEKPGVVVSSFKQGDCRGVIPQRDDLYLFLAKHGVINLYGKNWKVAPKKNIFGPTDNKLLTISRYPYSLVIENSWTPGYVTEKLPDCILAGVPVIYWGDFYHAQRRFPGTFVPLQDLTADNVLKARKQLFSHYYEMRKQVLLVRENSDTWCNSYLVAIQKALMLKNNDKKRNAVITGEDIQYKNSLC